MWRRVHLPAVRSTQSAVVQALGIQVRAGLHTGECEIRGDDISGIAVHIGARVSALAGPNDVLVSSTLPRPRDRVGDRIRGAGGTPT
jgi:class 3 adenylate cyclase